MKITVNVVGFSYRGTTPSVLQVAGSSQFLLCPEPTNPHDKDAVKFLIKERHVGYIQKEKSSLVVSLLRRSKSHRISIARIAEKFATIDIEFEIERSLMSNDIGQNLPAGPGIYQITFERGGQKWAYYGQSIDIRSRTGQHLRDLNNGVHKNKVLQEGWNENQSRFIFSVKELVSDAGSPLLRQILLFKRELHYIESSDILCANVLNGDLVLSGDAKNELEKIRDLVEKAVVAKLADLNFIRDSIGEIMLREKLVTGYGVKIEKSNILSNINRKRYSPLEPMVSTDTAHPLFSHLKSALQANQNKKIKIQEERKFLKLFPSQSSTSSKYTTTSIDEVAQFLAIVEKYENGYKSFKASNHTRPRAKIEYNPILEGILPAEVILMLRNGVEKVQAPAQQGRAIAEEKSAPKSILGRLFGR